MTKENLEQRIQNLDGWIAFYDKLITKTKEYGESERHGGFSLEDPHPEMLGMPSISQIKPPENLDSNIVRTFESSLRRSTEQELKILTLNSWKSELKEQRDEFKKKLDSFDIL